MTPPAMTSPVVTSPSVTLSPAVALALPPDPLDVQPLAAVLCAFRGEMARVVGLNSEVQDALSSLCGQLAAASPALVALQSLDRISQHLSSFETFLDSLQHQVPEHVMVDVSRATDRIGLSDLALSLTGATRDPGSSSDDDAIWL